MMIVECCTSLNFAISCSSSLAPCPNRSMASAADFQVKLPGQSHMRRHNHMSMELRVFQGRWSATWRRIGREDSDNCHNMKNISAKRTRNLLDQTAAQATSQNASGI